MEKIAVLGPQRTFTDLAAGKYLLSTNTQMERIYFSSIARVFHAIGKECSYGIVPIENTLDGYVQVTLDLLENSDLKIIHEVVLPIRFTFVSNGEVDRVNKIFAQFKTQNQCLNFLEGLGEVDIITTQSNGTSYEEYLKGNMGEAAIVPSHMVDENAVHENMIVDVADSIHNETRFVILGKNLNVEESEGVNWKTSFVVSSDTDRPGLLCNILNEFSQRDINMLSIISRPQKNGLGNYNFFIDIEGCYKRDDKVREAVELIMKNYSIKILGSYCRL